MLRKHACNHSIGQLTKQSIEHMFAERIRARVVDKSRGNAAGPQQRYEGGGLCKAYLQAVVCKCFAFHPLSIGPMYHDMGQQSEILDIHRVGRFDDEQRV